MANCEIQNHAFCLLIMMVVQLVNPVIPNLVPFAKLVPLVVLYPFSFLIEDSSFESRISFLFFQKSACPEYVLRLHWIRYIGVCLLSKISSDWWFLSILDRVRSHKPPWTSLHISSRQWIRDLILYLCAMEIIGVVKINGDCKADRRCPHRLMGLSTLWKIIMGIDVAQITLAVVVHIQEAGMRILHLGIGGFRVNGKGQPHDGLNFNGKGQQLVVLY